MSELELSRRIEFVEYVRDGMGRLRAAMAVGWSPRQLEARLREPEFVESIELAAFMQNEAVETTLYRLAIAGNMTAVQMWLYNRDPKRWKDTKRVEITQQTTIDINIEATKESFLELVAAGRLSVGDIQIGGSLDRAIEATSRDDDAHS